MIIINEGIDSYLKSEKEHRHHRLYELANFIPNLRKNEKDGLCLLTNYVYWAGRYPGSGYGKEHETEEIFTVSEKYQITAKELFALAEKVMKHAQKVIEI